MFGRSTFGIAVAMGKWLPVWMVDRLLLTMAGFMLGSTERYAKEKHPNHSFVTLELTEKAGCTVGELGVKLKGLTNVGPDTMRLLVPQSKRSSAASLVPFSDNHGKLRLAETGITEGQTIRMMGVFSADVEEISHPAKSDQRIAGFLEEERRAKQLRANGPKILREFPEEPYIFYNFCTLGRITARVL